MCGIAGYVGPRQAESILLVALERLKYRGYDSAGMAVADDDAIQVHKTAGRLFQLEQQLALAPLAGTCGIGHTRWATHGPPDATNAHPHCTPERDIALVHNGIIENHEELRRELVQEGVTFVSQTDTEVIPHLLSKHYRGDPLEALRSTVARLEGSYAFAVVFAEHGQRILAVRRGSPLLVGRGPDASLLASDLPALLPHSEQYFSLEDGEIADCAPDGIRLVDFAGRELPTRFQAVEMDVDAVSKGHHDSFMAKEIAEQPEALRAILDSRIAEGRLCEPDLGTDLATVRHIVFLACGTSWHAALLGKRFLEHLARVHVEVDISSEYRYRNPVASGDTLVVAISQSGETADTLAGLRLARSKFLPVVSLVNVIDSTIARESDGVLPLLAGPEIGVASTKAYTAQVLALYLFALQMAAAKGCLPGDDLAARLSAAAALPALVERTLAVCEEPVRRAVEIFAAANATVFLGRGGEFPTALEGALKLKEIAYIHAMGYAAGEFKHGPIALVTQSLPVICCCPRDRMRDKMMANIEEVRARSGRIIVVADEGDDAFQAITEHVFPVAAPGDEPLQPLLTILPLQRYAYHVARTRGCDVDQPRNLAKSVTVE